MNFLNLFLANVIFNNFIINRLLNNNPDIGLVALYEIQKDFETIGFPIAITINSWLITIAVSLASSLFIYYFVFLKLNTTKPESILSALMSIFLIYSGVLFYLLYFLRVFNLSRGLLLLFTLIYSLIFLLLLIILKSNVLFKIKNINFIKSFVFIAFLASISFIIYSLQNNEEETLSVELSFDEPEYEQSSLATNNGDCHSWAGSNNFDSCLLGAQVEIVDKFSDSLNNLIVFEDNTYLLDAFGVVFLNNPDTIFIDLRDKIMNRIDGYGTETGLIGLVFHPTEDYFLISFTDFDNNLTVEKYYLNDQKMPILDSVEKLIKIPGTAEYHLGGNMIWSEYFNDFLISVGDMEMNAVPLLNSEPFDTTSPRGKILFLENEISKPELLSVTNRNDSRKDILAYGLRNPWKTYEYKNFLFVPDIGNNTEEELNVINLDDFKKNDNQPYLFGWPYFEGSIDNEVQFNEILLWEDNESKSISSYIYENSIKPKVYYQHIGPTYYRAALIGGEVIDDPSSSYHEHYIFGDYLSKELFSYDFKNDVLYQIPIEGFQSYITSIIIDKDNKDSVLITSGDGNLVRVLLPNK